MRKIKFNSIDELFRKPIMTEQESLELKTKLWDHWKHYSFSEFMRLTGKDEKNKI